MKLPTSATLFLSHLALCKQATASPGDRQDTSLHATTSTAISDSGDNTTTSASTAFQVQFIAAHADPAHADLVDTRRATFTHHRRRESVHDKLGSRRNGAVGDSTTDFAASCPPDGCPESSPERGTISGIFNSTGKAGKNPVRNYMFFPDFSSSVTTDTVDTVSAVNTAGAAATINNQHSPLPSAMAGGLSLDPYSPDLVPHDQHVH